MVCLGLEPGAAGCQAQTNPVSYGGTRVYWEQILLSFSLSLSLIIIYNQQSKKIVSSKNDQKHLISLTQSKKQIIDGLSTFKREKFGYIFNVDSTYYENDVVSFHQNVSDSINRSYQILRPSSVNLQCHSIMHYTIT